MKILERLGIISSYKVSAMFREFKQTLKGTNQVTFGVFVGKSGKLLSRKEHVNKDNVEILQTYENGFRYLKRYDPPSTHVEEEFYLKIFKQND